MSDKADETTRRRRRRRGRPTNNSAAVVAATTPLDDGNLLADILLRLPARPSWLPRAAAVCRQWRRVVSDPGFLRHFVRGHHRKPPLVGFFYQDFRSSLQFMPTMDPPDHIPAARFPLRVSLGSSIVCCRHGRVLILNQNLQHCLISVTGDQLHVAFPPMFDDDKIFVMNGAIVCAAAAQDQDHVVHGACHSDPFRVALVAKDRTRLLACVYSSETRAWGNLISIMLPQNVVNVSDECSSVMMGSSICWMVYGREIAVLELDLDRQRLGFMDYIPPEAFDFSAFDSKVFFKTKCQFLIKPLDGGGLGFIVIAGSNARVWKWVPKNGDDGVSEWMLWSTTELSNLLPLKPAVDVMLLRILGCDEDGNLLVKLTHSGDVFMVSLESSKIKKLPQKIGYCLCHPFTSFYTPDEDLVICWFERRMHYTTHQDYS